MLTSPIWKVEQESVHYTQALEYMESYVHDIIHNNAPNLVWLLEHFDVYTIGTSAQKNELLGIPSIEVIKTNRGGKITYHGIGQRIVYPIVSLNRTKDIRKYVTNLESWIINTLNDYNIDAFTKKDFIGIWVVEKGIDKKIAAIGIRIKKWVAYHGIAININPNLDYFSGIIPCGISNFGVTSLERLKKNISFHNFDDNLKKNFSKVFIHEE